MYTVYIYIMPLVEYIGKGYDLDRTADYNSTVYMCVCVMDGIVISFCIIQYNGSVKGNNFPVKPQTL